MKKFQFTLETLKKYNDRILDTEKNTLGILRKEAADIEKELAATHHRLNLAHEEKREMCLTGTTPIELTVQQRYISELSLRIHQLEAELEEKRREVEAQLNKVVEATKEVSKLEKLEQKQLEEYRRAEKKEEENFIEEFVSNTSHLKNN